MKLDKKVNCLVVFACIAAVNCSDDGDAEAVEGCSAQCVADIILQTKQSISKDIYVMREEEDAQVAGGAFIATALCDGEDQVLGGGCSVADLADDRSLFNSEPNTGEGWECRYERRQFDIDNNVQSIQINVTAICLASTSYFSDI